MKNPDYKTATNLRTVNTRAILPIARILFRMISLRAAADPPASQTQTKQKSVNAMSWALWNTCYNSSKSKNNTDVYQYQDFFLRWS